MLVKLSNTFCRFRRDDSGAALVEYAVTLIVVVVVGIALMQGIGTTVGKTLGKARAAADSSSVTVCTATGC